MVPALKATRRIWKATAMPRKRARVPLQRTFTKPEFTKLSKGFVPQSMDDRWFIFFEEGWLYFHRSWTGRCIFQIRLQAHKPGYQVAEAWVNQDPQQYRGGGIDGAVGIISNLMDRQLLAHRPWSASLEISDFWPIIRIRDLKRNDSTAPFVIDAQHS